MACWLLIVDRRLNDRNIGVLGMLNRDGMKTAVADHKTTANEHLKGDIFFAHTSILQSLRYNISCHSCHKRFCGLLHDIIKYHALISITGMVNRIVEQW